MNKIIPYNKKLISGDRGFINPNGEIIFTYGMHERFARDYC